MFRALATLATLATLVTPATALTTEADLARMSVSRLTESQVIGGRAASDDRTTPHPYCVNLYRTNPYLRADDAAGILTCSENQWGASKRLYGR